MNSKTIKIIVLNLMFAFIANIGMSQYQVSSIKKREHLNMLHNGVLLVRLPNNDKQIAALKKAGLDKRVEIEKKENEELNSLLIEYFTKYYTFNEFYFFNSRDSKAVLNGEYDNMIFDGEGNIIVLENSRELYMAQIHAYNPPGEQTRYNTKGVQIKYIKNGEIHAINKDFFAGLYPIIDLLNLGNKRYRNAIINLNSGLFNFLSKRSKKKRKKKKEITTDSN